MLWNLRWIQSLPQGGLHSIVDLLVKLCRIHNNDDDEYICNAQFKQSSNAPLLHYRAVVKSLSFRAYVWMDNVSYCYCNYEINVYC